MGFTAGPHIDQDKTRRLHGSEGMEKCLIPFSASSGAQLGANNMTIAMVRKLTVYWTFLGFPSTWLFESHPDEYTRTASVGS
jgi:hypothetical protein